VRLVLILALLGCSGSSEPPSGSASEATSESETASESEAASESETASESTETASESTETASEPETAPTPNTLRLVVVHDGPELLGSEERQIAELRSGLARGRTVDGGPPTDRESAWLERGEGALPAAWATFETVVVLRVAAPRTLRRNSRRMSRGLRSVHVLRPPETVPAYALDGGAEGPVGLAADGELAWLRALLDALSSTRSATEEGDTAG